MKIPKYPEKVCLIRGIPIELELKKNGKTASMDEKMDVGSIPESKKGGVNPKVFFVGLPLFILQLIVVYFVTANILLSKMQNGSAEAAPADSAQAAAEEIIEEPGEVGIFNLEDVIVNPTGTNGQRLLLASIGFEVQGKEELEAIEKKKEIVTDIVITSLSSKNVDQLNNNSFRDTLKVEIGKSITHKFPKIKINNIYFSKFIIQ